VDENVKNEKTNFLVKPAQSAILDTHLFERVEEQFA